MPLLAALVAKNGFPQKEGAFKNEGLEPRLSLQVRSNLAVWQSPSPPPSPPPPSKPKPRRDPPPPSKTRSVFRRIRNFSLVGTSGTALNDCGLYLLFRLYCFAIGLREPPFLTPSPPPCLRRHSPSPIVPDPAHAGPLVATALPSLFSRRWSHPFIPERLKAWLGHPSLSPELLPPSSPRATTERSFTPGLLWGISELAAPPG